MLSRLLILFFVAISINAAAYIQEMKPTHLSIKQVTGYKVKQGVFHSFEEELKHPSAHPENGVRFQRLELLGDRVIGLVLTTELMKLYPKDDEGQLTGRMDPLKSNENHTEIAKRMALDKFVSYRSETPDGTKKILADVCEAFIGAAYESSQFNLSPKLTEFIHKYWLQNGTATLPKVKATSTAKNSSKTRQEIQMLMIRHDLTCPSYNLRQSGSSYIANGVWGSLRTGEVSAPGKKSAKELAAAEMLRQIQADPSIVDRLPRTRKGKKSRK